MGKRIIEYKFVNIFLAILIAVALWVYVTTVVNPDGGKDLKNVEVTFLGEDVLNGKGLMIDPSDEATLDLRLTGNRNTLVKVTAADIVVTADVTNISAAGEYTLACKVLPPSSVTGGTVTVENGTSQTIRINVIKMLSKTLEVRGYFAGGVRDGYRTNDFTISPSAITVQGPESLINQLEYAQVTVSGTDLVKTYTNDLGFEYISTEGNKLSDPQIASNVDTVNVILPVVKLLEVSLDVEFTNGGGATLDNVEYSISPATIQVSGEEEDVVPLEGKVKTLGVIDLAKVADTATIKLPIDLAPELTNDSGVTEATVTIKVTGLVTKTFETDNIQVINPPQGYSAIPVTQSLQVRVRGTEEALQQVFDYKLRVVVDMKDQEFSPGQFRLPAKVYLDTDGQAGVVGENYVVVSVSIS